MGRKRVVTRVDPDSGRSLIQEVTPDFPAALVCYLTRGADSAIVPSPGQEAPYGMGEPPGGVMFRVFDLPPDSVMDPVYAAGTPPFDERGFHATGTVDLVYVVNGQLTLELDEGSVDLGAGDVLVQQDARHAWRNRTDGTVTMAVVMLNKEAAPAQRPDGCAGATA